MTGEEIRIALELWEQGLTNREIALILLRQKESELLNKLLAELRTSR